MQPLMTSNLSSVWSSFRSMKGLALLRGPAGDHQDRGLPAEFFRGRVDYLGSVVDAATRTVRLRATVLNTGEKLRPGMFVKAQVEVPKPAAEAKAILAVPQSALQTLDGRTTVFVQREPGVFVRHLVETGHTFEGFTEILSGVKPGDVIVTEGSFVLKSEFAKASLVEEDGDAATTRRLEPRKPAAGPDRGRAARGGRQLRLTQLPIDAVPDITNVQVQILTKAPALGRSRWSSS